MKSKNLLLLVLLSAMQLLNAQTANKKVAVGLNLGKTEYNGDFGNALFRPSQPFYYSGGLSLATYLNPSFDLGIQGNYGDYGYYTSQSENFLGRKLAASLFTHYKLNNGYILKEDAKLSPFVSLGLGFGNYSRDLLRNQIPAARINTGSDFIVPLGVGLKYQISESFAIQYQFIYNFTNKDNHDKNLTNNKKDAWADHLVGIVISFGAPKDEDNDGVADKLDNCLGTPVGIEVDESGCPVDLDNDGVADYLDKCPGIAGLAKFNGCPDTDGDGVQDSEDSCPEIVGIAKFNGCPDTDNDGIQDSKDECPTVAGLAIFNGCPDSDNDGVADSMDKCPGTIKDVKVDASGCPIDTDGDGVPDSLDKCPTVPGIAANKGCPEVKAEVKKIFAQALQGIQFESGKDVIKKTSFGILDKVVSIMKNNPSYNLEINGHTDSQGDDATNMLLSQKRSDAVKTYLVNKGVDASKLSAKGYGETVPVADNATAAGRAKNRRVEFKVNF